MRVGVAPDPASAVVGSVAAVGDPDASTNASIARALHQLATPQVPQGLFAYTSRGWTLGRLAQAVERAAASAPAGRPSELPGIGAMAIETPAFLPRPTAPSVVESAVSTSRWWGPGLENRPITRATPNGSGWPGTPNGPGGPATPATPATPGIPATVDSTAAASSGAGETAAAAPEAAGARKGKKHAGRAGEASIDIAQRVQEDRATLRDILKAQRARP